VSSMYLDPLSMNGNPGLIKKEKLGYVGKTLRRFQYTAIDDATRIRALKIYPRHTQANAIEFIDYVVDRFPFRIHTIRTDRGHEVSLSVSAVVSGRVWCTTSLSLSRSLCEQTVSLPQRGYCRSECPCSCRLRNTSKTSSRQNPLSARRTRI